MKTVVQRTYIPGGDWAYFKIYTGIRTADWILCEILSPIINRLSRNNLIKKFFFVRYTDPDFHIRIRLLLTKPQHLLEVMDTLNKALKPIVNKRLVWKVQLDTYQRELERYNPYLIEDVESVFWVDSLCIIGIIHLLESHQKEEYRWMISLLLVDRLLSDFGYSLHSKKDLMRCISQSFKQEFGLNQSNSILLNQKYRVYKQFVESAFNSSVADKDYSKLLNIVDARSKKMKPFINSILKIAVVKRLNIQDYIISYLHMTINRLFRTQNRLYELVIYDFLRRHYLRQIVLSSR